MSMANSKYKKSNFFSFFVLVPPNIIDEGTSGDVVVREGHDASISCKADGRPPPRITWRREDSSYLQLRNSDNNYSLSKNNTTITVLTLFGMARYTS